jgi:rhodanese-related sulfurtransferase
MEGGASAMPELPAPVESVAAADSPITLENLDQYMMRDDVQYVDVRELDEKFGSGYIHRFELVPFFGFLEGRMVTRSDEEGQAWVVAEGEINEDFAYDNYFQRDKAIFIFCAGGTRAGYVKGVLDQQGFTTYNLGGFKDYDGEYKVLGDPSFEM